MYAGGLGDHKKAACVGSCVLHLNRVLKLWLALEDKTTGNVGTVLKHSGKLSVADLILLKGSRLWSMRVILEWLGLTRGLASRCGGQV